MKFTRSRNQVGPKEACMNEGGEGTEQDSSVAPTGTSSSPALESPSACVGPPGPRDERGTRLDPNCPAHLTCSRAGGAAHRAGGSGSGMDVAPPGPSGLRWGRHLLPRKSKN